MTTDPKTVQQLATEHILDDARRAHDIGAAVLGHFGPDALTKAEYHAYCDAIREAITTATVAVSWPDAQPQDDDTPHAERLAQIRDRNRRLAAVPWDLHNGTHGPGCIPCELVRAVGDVSWLLERLSQQQAIIARVTDRMREYDRHGGGSVNVRQVLNLLSPTWPDGNYEAAPAGGERG